MSKPQRRNYYRRFVGKPAVLEALRVAGRWSPHDVFIFGCRNGGPGETYGALRHYVDRGVVQHYPRTEDDGEHWEATQWH